MKDVILLPHVSCKTTGNSTHVPHARTQDTHNQVPYSPLLYSVVRRLWLVICCQIMCVREHTEYFCSPVKIISHCYTIREMFLQVVPQLAAFLDIFCFLVVNMYNHPAFVCNGWTGYVVLLHLLLPTYPFFFFSLTTLHFTYTDVNAPKCESRVWSKPILQSAIYILTSATAIFSSC